MNKELSCFKKKENGSALLYVLLLISIVGIVGTLMLTTVTQGQQNIVKNEEILVRLYKAEGAFEIVLLLMEEYENPIDPNESGPYYYIKNVISPSRSYSSFGTHSTNIMAEVIGDPFSDPNIEPDTVEVLLYDPLNDKSYRRIVADRHTGDWTNPYPPPPPGGDGIAYTYLNGYEAIYQNSNKNDPLYLPDNPIITTEGYLVIPSNIGEVEYKSNTPVEFNADQGIFIGAHLTTKASFSSIDLSSDSGYIIVDGATFETGAASNGSVSMQANTYLSAVATKIEAKAGVALIANQYIDVRNATVSVLGANTISIISGQCINVDGAYFSKTPVIPPGIPVVGTPRAGSAPVNNSDPFATCP